MKSKFIKAILYDMILEGNTKVIDILRYIEKLEKEAKKWKEKRS